MIFLKNKIGFGVVVIWPIIFVGLFALPSEIKAPIGNVSEVEKKNSSGTVFPVVEVAKKNSEPIKPVDKIIFDVPFMSQAPFGKWSDPRQGHGCEEASALMAMAWVRGISELSRQESEKEIIAISEYELKKYGNYSDTSAEDTVKRILNDYFKNENVKIEYNIGTEDIKKELFNGNIVIVPVNGRKLKNPFYTPPGPIEHMIVVIGYDSVSDEFITNDPGGVRRGEKLRYKKEILKNSLQDYLTGLHEPILEYKTAMIVVGKP